MNEKERINKKRLSTDSKLELRNKTGGWVWQSIESFSSQDEADKLLKEINGKLDVNNSIKGGNGKTRTNLTIDSKIIFETHPSHDGWKGGIAEKDVRWISDVQLLSDDKWCDD
jgi:N-acetylneuraminic acid mutarotase